MLIKEVTLGLLSALWVQRTQEKDSLQSKGIHANWPLWSLRKPGARQIPLPAATLVSVVSWSGLLKYWILPELINLCWTDFRAGGDPPPTISVRP